MLIKDFAFSDLTEIEISYLLETSIIANMIMLESMMGDLNKPDTTHEAKEIVRTYTERLPDNPELRSTLNKDAKNSSKSRTLEVFSRALNDCDSLICCNMHDSQMYWHCVLEAMAPYIFDRITVLWSGKLNSFLKIDFFIKNDRWEILIKKDDGNKDNISLLYCKVNGGVVNVDATLGFVNYCYFIAKRIVKTGYEKSKLNNLHKQKVEDIKHLDMLLTQETTANQVALLAITAIKKARNITSLEGTEKDIASKNLIINAYNESLEELQYAGDDQVLNSVSDYLKRNAKSLINDNIDSILKYHLESKEDIWNCANSIALSDIYENEIRANPERDSYLLTLKHHEDEWVFFLRKYNDHLALSKITLNSIDISNVHKEMVLTSGIRCHCINLIEDATKIPVFF